MSRVPVFVFGYRPIWLENVVFVVLFFLEREREIDRDRDREMETQRQPCDLPPTKDIVGPANGSCAIHGWDLER